MVRRTTSYLMENEEESIRLEVKTDPEAVRRQALWCGLKPGLKILDAGCGSGKVSSILHEMVQPGGKIVGVDYSEDRIRHARAHYSEHGEPFYELRDLRDPLNGLGSFDLAWARFVLEYNRAESEAIIQNLDSVLKPGGSLCLMDLDHNCLSHYELPPRMETILFAIMEKLEKNHNFDPYAGRRLYARLYDLGYEDIQVDVIPHHLIFGKVKDEDVFNWIKKVEVISKKTRSLFGDYPGGHTAFFQDFQSFFLNPRRFTYTPLILCKGTKPATRLTVELGTV